MKCKDCYKHEIIDGYHYCFKYALKSKYEFQLNRKCLLSIKDKYNNWVVK